ncbi:MAG: AAA family ATPase [Candidatus Omnitrophica bacterium]|nr:AAA family ATPase [Candidatus Omnitrophota bacterium]
MITESNNIREDKILRTVFTKLCQEIDKPYISILIGPRQVGKTYLLRELESFVRNKGLRVRFFNLENPDDLNLFNQDESGIASMLGSAGDVVFLDEFHYLKNATKIFKMLYDTHTRVKIYASGSSSIEIHKHLKESLAGRFRKTVLGPLICDEYQNAGLWDKDTFFRFGGMPGLVHEKTEIEKMALLHNIVETYLMKDIKALIKEENIRAFNHLLHLMASWQGGCVIGTGNRALESCYSALLKYFGGYLCLFRCE